jgi:endonuclease/exonuclease/phosphatase family metal-dependent hydrolase
MFVIGLFLVLCGLVLWMAGGVQTPRTFEGPILQRGEAQTSTTSTLSVVVWNIAWAYGRGSEGSGSAKPPEHFSRSLEEISDVIGRLEPDLVLLQEVDFDAGRSHHMDQAEAIAKRTGLPYVAPAVSWIANYVPFPYWPPSDHFGRMKSGGAVLSRLPLEANEIRLLQKPSKNPFHYNLFYLFRYVQRVKVRWQGAPLIVFNAHLEAFDRDNRMLQAGQWREWLDQEAGDMTLVGGDFNTVPPESPHRSGFADEPETSFESDRTLALLRDGRGLRDAFATAAFLADPDAYYTFPADAPNRKLDHFLVTEDWQVVEARVVREAGAVSDHLPLFIRLAPQPR